MTNNIFLYEEFEYILNIMQEIRNLLEDMKENNYEEVYKKILLTNEKSLLILNEVVNKWKKDKIFIKNELGVFFIFIYFAILSILENFKRNH